MPFTTCPQIVYWPSSDGPGANMMKNWLLPLFGFEVRAMPQVPRRKCRLVVNSAGRSGSFEPPVPVPVGIAALRHEALDHPMERRVVVEPLARQRLDLRDGFRRQVGEHLDHHPAVFQVHVQRVFRIERRLGARRR